ncbi:hypothetical protein LY76DRAFT_157328 [Colletotrichum caudatum]|nr:hypothetical protein LY76DRAFT_157328 [Colletotrichum caudatum]
MCHRHLLFPRLQMQLRATVAARPQAKQRFKGKERHRIRTIKVRHIQIGRTQKDLVEASSQPLSTPPQRHRQHPDFCRAPHRRPMPRCSPVRRAGMASTLVVAALPGQLQMLLVHDRLPVCRFPNDPPKLTSCPCPARPQTCHDAAILIQQGRTMEAAIELRLWSEKVQV